MAEREQHVVKLENGLVQRQDQEVNALRQRIQTGAEEQRVARQQDLERLLRRYHNIKAELESQQNAERVRQRKGLSSLPGAHGSARAGSRAQLTSTASGASRPGSARGAPSVAQQTRPGSSRPSSAHSRPAVR